jgi:hypothetical protein
MNALEHEHAQGAQDAIDRLQETDARQAPRGTRQRMAGLISPAGTNSSYAACRRRQGRKVRTMHDSVMADPVSFLEADLQAMRISGELS